MQCIRPVPAGYNSAGELVYSNKGSSLELVGIKFPCRKCLPCRLNQSREKGIRSWHESKMHEDSIFLTLTYDDEHLESSKLIYSHWQDFLKSLRETRTRHCATKEQLHAVRIPSMVTGEYGELNKRPHWHALLFNYCPPDGKLKYTSEGGHKVFTSKLLDSLWEKGALEYGSVTLDSANYVARYAAKKLVHGNDQDHDFHPIHKTSSRYAIGRTWIEKYWKQTFNHGYIVMPDGTQGPIPRYYSDWLKKYQPEAFIRYVTTTRQEIINNSVSKSRAEELEYLSSVMSCAINSFPLPRSEIRHRILKSKFKQLQERLKL